MAGKVSTKEIGLILAARLLKTEDLHYGYWTDGLEVKLANLPQAQSRYSDYLMGQIPAGVETILDVGCGTGHLAELLTGKGFRVECISPSPMLTDLARKRLGEEFPIHRTPYEAFETDKRFDLILFSESFQYIRPENSLPKSHSLLNEKGHVLIADFFRIEAPGVSALKGGHDLKAFYAYLETLPFQVLKDEDITEQTAPNLDLTDEFIVDYVQPIWESMAYYLRENHSLLAKLGRKIFRKKLAKLEFKYFSNLRSGEEFLRHKSYHCLLLQKT